MSSAITTVGTTLADVEINWSLGCRETCFMKTCRGPPFSIPSPLRAILDVRAVGKYVENLTSFVLISCFVAPIVGIAVSMVANLGASYLAWQELRGTPVSAKSWYYASGLNLFLAFFTTFFVGILTSRIWNVPSIMKQNCPEKMGCTAVSGNAPKLAMGLFACALFVFIQGII